MDKRQVLLNINEAMKQMSTEKLAELAAYSEGLVFMARRQAAEQSAEQ